MPTLLRLAITAIALLVLLPGAVVLALSGGALIPGAIALSLTTTPVLVAGVLLSYWSWRDPAARGVRVWLVVCGAVSAVGLVWLAVVLAAAPAVGAWGVALVVLAILQWPAAALLGGAARRRERPVVVSSDVDEVLAGIRRGWRRIAVGASVGLAAGATASVLLIVGFGTVDLDWRAVLVTPIFGSLGISIGSLTATLRLAGLVRGLIGTDYSTSRRIGRAVTGKPEQLSEEEQARAARYAAVAPRWLRLQAVTQLANVLTTLAVVANAVSLQDGARWLLVAVAVLSGVLVLTAVATLLLQGRRIHVYAIEHPVPAP